MNLQDLANAIVDAIRTAVGLPRGDRVDAITRKVPVGNARVPIAGVNPNRSKLVVMNNDASAIEIGGRDLIYGQGIQIVAGATYIDDVNPFLGEWFAIANVAGPLDIRVRDES